MSFLKLKRFRLLRGPNLAASVPGAVCRLQIDTGQIADPQNYLQAFDQLVADQVSGSSAADVYRTADAESSFPVQITTRMASLALQLQQRLGSNVEVFRCNDLKDGIHVDFFLSFEYAGVVQRVIQFVLNLARRLQTADGDMPAYVATELKNLHRANNVLSPRLETCMIIRAIEKRGIPWKFLLGSNQFMKIGYGARQKVFQSQILDNEGHVSFKMTDDKGMTSAMLNEVGLPGTHFKSGLNLNEAQKFASEIGYPVVVKPLVGMQGYGVTPNIQNAAELDAAYKAAIKHNPKVIVEKHVRGDDHRMLVIDGKYMGCTKRSITRLAGDGKRSVQQLVDEVNQQPFRNRIPSSPKYQITRQKIITQTLEKQGYNWNSVPPKGAEIAMHIVPNISQGGTLETIEDVHPANIEMAERAARLFGLKVAGVDYLTEDITLPYWQSGGAICEVNARPALDVMKGGEEAHMEFLGRTVFEISCPPNKDMELPVIVIVGRDETFGDALKTQLQSAGLKVGQKRFDGAHIGLALPVFADNPQKAVDATLWDAAIDAAIIHESGLRLRRYGLGFEIFSDLVLTEVPQIDGRQYPEILTLLLKTVTRQAYYIEGRADVEAWMDQLPQALKSKLIGISPDALPAELASHIRARHARD